MRLRKKYGWYRQPNGKYTVLGVEFFAPFSREDGEGGEVSRSAEQLDAAVAKFREEKRLGHYPRVFLGHHDATNANRPGVGFLDRVRRQGETVYADLVEIPEERFEELRQGRWPYRSPEFAPESDTITGLALLESSRPYFVFPILALADAETLAGRDELDFCASRRVLIFQEKDMPEDPEIQDAPTDGAAPGGDAGMEGEAGGAEPKNPVEDPSKLCFQEQFQLISDDIAEMKASIDGLTSMLQQLLEMEEEEQEQEQGGEEGGGEDVDIPSGGEEGGMPPKENPTSVAYQDLKRRLDFMEARQMGSGEEAEIRRFCESRALDFGSVQETLRGFSSAKDRKNYLSTLENGFPRHRVSDGLERFSALPANDYEKLVLSFQAAHGREGSETARIAYRTFAESWSQRDERAARKFQAVWTQGGTLKQREACERFVRLMVEDPQARSLLNL